MSTFMSKQDSLMFGCGGYLATSTHLLSNTVNGVNEATFCRDCKELGSGSQALLLINFTCWNHILNPADLMSGVLSV